MGGLKKFQSSWSQRQSHGRWNVAINLRHVGLTPSSWPSVWIVLPIELQYILVPRKYRAPIYEQGVPFDLLYSVADCGACIRRCTTPETAQQVKGVALGQVIISGKSGILELHANADQAHPTNGNALLDLDLGLDGIDRIEWLDLDGDRLTRKRTYEELHTRRIGGRRLGDVSSG